MDWDYDDKGWDDHPARFFCRTCSDYCSGICECRNSNDYQECISSDHEACCFYHEEE